MDKSSLITRILVIIAGLLLICIGSFSMTRAIPSLYIALFYLIVGIIVLGWTVINLAKYNTKKK